MYYGNTSIKVLLHRPRACRGKKLEAEGSFRLLNCIYKKWMVERQMKTTDTYGPVDEESEFTPKVSFLKEQERLAYTIPFQKIEYHLICQSSLVYLFEKITER